MEIDSPRADATRAQKQKLSEQTTLRDSTTLRHLIAIV